MSDETKKKQEEPETVKQEREELSDEQLEKASGGVPNKWTPYVVSSEYELNQSQTEDLTKDPTNEDVLKERSYGTLFPKINIDL